MLENIFLISLSMSAAILLLLVISPFLNRRYSVKLKYFVWLILALRLVIPFRLELPKAPVNIPNIDKTVVLRNEGMPFQVMNDSYIKKGIASQDSNDYAPIITIKDFGFILWLVGTLTFFIYHITNYIIFKRKIKPTLCIYKSRLLDKILMELRLNLFVFTSSEIASPMMVGFIKPIILLPQTNYTENEIAVILKHELTHYKRHDIWYKLLLIIANSIHWFNPLVYLMVKQANSDLEYACDDMVVKNCDINYRKQYSLIILKAMEKDSQTTLSTYLNGGIGNE